MLENALIKYIPLTFALYWLGSCRFLQYRMPCLVKHSLDEGMESMMQYEFN